MNGRGRFRAVASAAGNQRRDVAEPRARRSGLRLAIFSCTGRYPKRITMAQAEGRTGNPLATALPFAVFALLALISWNRWLEPYVDSGRELMVPGRVAGGERLYSQIEFHHGPLAPYIGAAIDRVFGRSLPART